MPRLQPADLQSLAAALMRRRDGLVDGVRKQTPLDYRGWRIDDLSATEHQPL